MVSTAHTDRIKASAPLRGYTGAMSAVYRRYVNSSTVYLMSAAGRREIAESLRFCRKRHGQAEAVRFRQGLLWAGCIYPIARRRVWERLESV
jgi:hypothetical protein